ncbi:MAG: hypothetical protein WAQ05_11645 [Rubrivivax sp.]
MYAWSMRGLPFQIVEGAKPLVDTKGDSGAAAPACAAAPRPEARPPGITTECAGGRVLGTGSCKRPLD